jgi:hypothetical protein
LLEDAIFMQSDAGFTALELNFGAQLHQTRIDQLCKPDVVLW